MGNWKALQPQKSYRRELLIIICMVGVLAGTVSADNKSPYSATIRYTPAAYALTSKQGMIR